MTASLQVDLSQFDDMVNRITDQALKTSIEKVAQEKEVAAIISQAISDNFAKEGPGWAPLSAKTIRASVAKKLGRSLSQMSDKELEKQEKTSRAMGWEPTRMILQRTGLLKKSATIPGFTGSNAEASAHNIYKVEGNQIIWGTDLVYAGTHQNGNPKRHVPARPFMVLRSEWKERLFTYIGRKYESILAQFLRLGHD